MALQRYTKVLWCLNQAGKDQEDIGQLLWRGICWWVKSRMTSTMTWSLCCLEVTASVVCITQDSGTSDSRLAHNSLKTFCAALEWCPPSKKATQGQKRGFLRNRTSWSPKCDHNPPAILVRLKYRMKCMCAYFDTIRCVQEINGKPIYCIAPQPIEYHETPPVTGGTVCSLNKLWYQCQWDMQTNYPCQHRRPSVFPICHQNRGREIPQA